MSYCLTWITPWWRVCFQSPPSRMKATSRYTTYKKRTWSNGEIDRWPKLPYRWISFYFPGNFLWWFLSNRLCAFKSLRSGSIGVGEEQYIPKSTWSNGGYQRYGYQSITGSSKFYTSLSSRIFSIISYLFFGLVSLFAVLKTYFSLIIILYLIYAFIYFILFFT